jgi:hypothetical protein
MRRWRGGPWFRPILRRGRVQERAILTHRLTPWWGSRLGVASSCLSPLVVASDAQVEGGPWLRHILRIGLVQEELCRLTGSLPGGVALIGQSGPARGSGPSRLVLVRPAGRPEQLLGALLSVWAHLHQKMSLHGLRAAPPGGCWCSYLGLCCSKRNHCGRHIHRCGEDGGATISVTLAPNPHAVIWTPPAVVSFCDDRRFPQSHRFLTVARRHGEKAATAVQAQIR